MTPLGRPGITEVCDRESKQRTIVSPSIAIRRLSAGPFALLPNENAITRLVDAIP